VQDRRKRLLVQKQKAGQRWEGLWTLPHFGQFKKGLVHLGLEKKGTKKLRTDKHGFTRYQITLHSFRASLTKKSFPAKDYRWMDSAQIKKAAFPAVYQKIVDEVLSR
jgi:adenine-specific DNA glycosylase